MRPGELQRPLVDRCGLGETAARFAEVGPVVGGTDCEGEGASLLEAGDALGMGASSRYHLDSLGSCMAETPELVEIACSLDAADMASRVAEFEHLFMTALASQRREPGQLRLEFAVAGEDEAAVRDLLAREAECCRFFSFGFERDGDTLVVTMDVPDAAQPVLDEFEALAARAGHVN